MVATSTADGTSTRSIDPDRIAVVLALATIVLVPVARGWILWSAPGGRGDINQWVATSPFDWPLALLIVVQASAVLEDRLSGGHRPAQVPLPVRLLAVTLAWMTLCALLTPSWRALDLAFHVAGAWALVRTARRADAGERTTLLAAIVVLGAFQAVLGIVQSRVGDTVGLGPLEFEGPLYTFGGTTAGRGSLTHPYHLTALLVVCAGAGALLASRTAGWRRPAALAALGVMGVAIPLTFSRAAIVGLVPMLLLWAAPRRTRVIAGVLAGGLLVGAMIGANGVSAKAGRTVDVDAVDSGRRQRLEEALNLVEEEPVFGVGPGRYVIALREVDHEELLPPHNIVLHAGAEAGVVGGALVLATAVAFGWWLLRRRSAMLLAIGVSLLPFHLLDSYPHVFPVGLLVTGMWLAVLAIGDSTEATTSPAPGDAR